MELDHIVLNVSDVEAAVGFYVDVIGLETERLDKYRSGEVLFPSVRINEQTIIDLFPPQMWLADNEQKAARPNLNHFCLALRRDEWDSLRQRLAERNIELSRDRTVNFGAKGNGISMYFRDLDGNEIEARYYESG